ncbi:MAG: FecR family protein, partial [Caldanaerobacter sp.]
MGNDLFDRYFEGSLNEVEFKEFIGWLESESLCIQNRENIQTLWQNYHPSSELADDFKYNRILDKIHHQINIKNTEPKPVGRGYSIKDRVLSIITKAAAILLVPILALYIYTSQLNHTSFESNANFVSVESPAGSRLQLNLVDGTKVWLNGNSILTYPQEFNSKKRIVKLEGEAFFEVAHNTEIPFIVETDRMSVKATGTAFNVNAYAKEDVVETALLEGSVSLYGSDGRRLSALSPGECLKYSVSENRYVLTKDDINKYIGWKDGMIVCKNDPIDEIVKRVERLYNVEIEYADARVKELTYTGTFDNVSLNQLLSFMSLATPITYKYLPNVKNESISHQKIEIG